MKNKRIAMHIIFATILCGTPLHNMNQDNRHNKKSLTEKEAEIEWKRRYPSTLYEESDHYSPSNYKKAIKEDDAKTEWFKRYPCTPYEESDCYYPYQGDYKKGIKRDNKRRASYENDDY